MELPTFKRLGHTGRRPELDALRGLFLVWMTFTHLPTRLRDLVNQPFGFISSAEGFVFLSAMLVAEVSIHMAREDARGVHAKLWKRAVRLYGYHVLMLALAFTLAAAFALNTHRTAIHNLLNFYLAHPFTAIPGSLLLIYCPPLLDILPMYVIFLALTPSILTLAVRRGWGRILAVSAALWLLAQFGLRTWIHNLVVNATGLHIPQQETGAFNLFAWQALWVVAMWLGAKSAEGENPLRRLPRFVFPASALICLFFLGIRHGWLGARLTPPVIGIVLDKWQLGPLRVLNLAAFGLVLYWLREYAAPLVTVEPLVTLGKASLEVFCAHIVFVFVGLALLYDEVAELHGLRAAILVTFTLTGLVLVAATTEARRKRARIALKSAADTA